MEIQSWKMVPKAGSMNRLKLVDETLPDPCNEEVQIEVSAIGLNFADIFAIYGLYSATPEGSFVPGLEYSGVVVKTGPDVQGFKKGMRVMGLTRFGGYTTGLNIDQRYLVALPQEWNFDEGAAYLVQVLTAWYALVELGNIHNGSTVLIHSAAGGVGIWANRIARHFNAHTIGCVGNTAKLEVLKDEGYSDGFVRDNNFRDELKKKLDDRPLDIVMECIGGKIFVESYEALAPEGRVVVYGSARYGQTGARPNYIKLFWQFMLRPKLDPQKLIEENKAVLGFNLIHLYQNADKMKQILSELEKLEIGRPYVGHTFSFPDLKEALKLFQSGTTTGKVVVKTVGSKSVSSRQ